jgi:hypothetical protein
MKASELRIGNRVNYFSESADRWLDDHEVTALDIECLDLDKGDHADGIPLTEEWLLNFGFWKREGSNVWNNGVGNYRYCIHQTGMLYPFDVRSSDPSGYFIGTTKYVHQLQNLYFALTGEELTDQKCL